MTNTVILHLMTVYSTILRWLVSLYKHSFSILRCFVTFSHFTMVFCVTNTQILPWFILCLYSAIYILWQFVLCYIRLFCVLWWFVLCCKYSLILWQFVLYYITHFAFWWFVFCYKHSVNLHFMTVCFALEALNILMVFFALQALNILMVFCITSVKHFDGLLYYKH